MPRHRAHSVLRVRFGARRRKHLLSPLSYLLPLLSPLPHPPLTKHHPMAPSFPLPPFPVLFPLPCSHLFFVEHHMVLLNRPYFPPFFGPVVASLDHCRPPVLFDQISSFFCLQFHPFFPEPFPSPPSPAAEPSSPLGAPTSIPQAQSTRCLHVCPNSAPVAVHPAVHSLAARPR